jgi:hypothetical protein
MRTLRQLIAQAARAVWEREEGALGWLLLGIIAGIGLVIYGVYVLVT